jgi:hypothetical protein
VLPLTQVVRFKAVLQAGNRVQVPNVVRWEFKMDHTQVLSVAVKVADQYEYEQKFYGKMRSDGRITVPKRLLEIVLRAVEGSESSGEILFDVSVEPARKLAQDADSDSEE